MSIFKNRVALITGASGEIGKELAIELNKKGASSESCKKTIVLRISHLA